jgi:MATE family multidrug resistance protein
MNHHGIEGLIVSRLNRIVKDYFAIGVQGGCSEIWRITWPLVIVNAGNTILVLVNQGFLAHHRLEEVTAAVPVSQVFYMAMSFFLVTCGFTGTIVAQNFGRGDVKQCVRAAWNGFYFGCAVAILLGILLPLCGPWFFNFGKLSPEVKAFEVSYLRWLSPCAGLTCMETAFLSFFTAIGRTKLVATIKLGACALGVPLNYIFIFGKCGFPELGIVGAALASVAASVFSVIAAMVFFLSQDQKKIPTRHFRRLDFGILRQLLVFGAPGGMETCIKSSVWAITIVFLSYLGEVSLTASNIAMTINSIAFVPLIGLMDASSVITGKYIGMNRYDVAGRIAGRAFRMLAVYMGFFALIYIFSPGFLIAIFSSKQQSGISFDEVIPLTRMVLLCMAVQNFFDGWRYTIMGGLRGAGDTQIPMLLSLATSAGVQLPAAYFSVMVFHLPIWGAWFFAVTCYVAVDALVIFRRMRTEAWRNIAVIDRQSVPA